MACSLSPTSKKCICLDDHVLDPRHHLLHLNHHWTFGATQKPTLDHFFGLLVDNKDLQWIACHREKSLCLVVHGYHRNASNHQGSGLLLCLLQSSVNYAPTDSIFS